MIIEYLSGLIAGLHTATGLNVYHESVATSCKPPCITVYEVGNVSNKSYDTHARYSIHNVVSYQVSIYAYDMNDIIEYTADVCDYMFLDKWHKTNTYEMINQTNGLIRKTITFQKYE